MNAVVIHLQIPDSSAVTKCSCPAALAHIKQMFPVQRLPHKLRPSILVIWFTADGKLSSIIKLYFILQDFHIIIPRCLSTRPQDTRKARMHGLLSMDIRLYSSDVQKITVSLEGTFCVMCQNPLGKNLAKLYAFLVEAVDIP